MNNKGIIKILPFHKTKTAIYFKMKSGLVKMFHLTKTRNSRNPKRFKVMNDADGMKLLKGFHGRIKWIKYRCAMPGTKDLKKNSLVIDVCLK